MNIGGLSTESIKALHDLIRECLEADDAAAASSKPYGVRQHPDWKKQADGFEAELEERGEDFVPIDW